MRRQRCRRERDGPRCPAAAVNGPVPPVLSRFAFPWFSPRVLRSARIAAAAAARLTRQPGAACALRGRRRHRPNRAPGRTKDAQTPLFPQDTTLLHGPAVLGSVGARGGSGEGLGGSYRGQGPVPGGWRRRGTRTVRCLARAGDKSRVLGLTTSSGPRPALPPPPAAGPVGVRSRGRTGGRGCSADLGGGGD